MFYDNFPPDISFFCFFLYLPLRHPYTLQNKPPTNLLRGWGEASCPALCGEGGDLGDLSCEVSQMIFQMSVPLCTSLAEVSASYKFLWLSWVLRRETGSLPTQAWVSTSFKLLNQISLICFPNRCWHLLSAVISSHSLCSCGFVFLNPLMYFWCGYRGNTNKCIFQSTMINWKYLSSLFVKHDFFNVFYFNIITHPFLSCPFQVV